MNKFLDVLYDVLAARGSKASLKDALTEVVATNTDLPAAGTEDKFYIARADATNSGKPTLYLFTGGVYVQAAGAAGSGGGSTALDPAYGSMILNDTVNLIKSNFRGAEARNAPKYTWKNMAVDVLYDNSGVDVGLSSTSLTVSSGQASPTASGLVSIIPVMSSNTAPSGVASSSSNYPGYDAFKAMDRVGGTSGWQTANGANDLPAWIAYDLGPGQQRSITRYMMMSRYTSSSSNNFMPKKWDLQGSNDGVTWTTLDSQDTAASWTADVAKTWNIPATALYRMFRIYIYSVLPGSSQLVDLEEIDFLGQPLGTTVLITKADTLAVQPTKIVVSAEYTGAVTFDVSVDDGATWLTNIALDSFVDLSGKTGNKLRIRANMGGGTSVQSIGYSWFDTSVTMPSTAALDQSPAILTNVLNTLKTNYRLAEVGNLARYSWDNFVIDAFNSNVGIDSNLSTIGVYNGAVVAASSGTDLTDGLPAGNCSTSSAFNASFDASHAFNNVWDEYNGGWQTTNGGGAVGTWIQVDLGVGVSKKINKLTIQHDADFIGKSAPFNPATQVKLSASNDGSTFVDTATGINLALNTTRQTFSITPPNTGYRYWRITQTATQISSGISAFSEIEMLEEVPSNATAVTTSYTLPGTASRMVLDAEYTGTITFDVSKDNGTTWKTNVPLRSFIDLSNSAGNQIRVRANMSAGAKIQSLGYAIQA